MGRIVRGSYLTRHANARHEKRTRSLNWGLAAIAAVLCMFSVPSMRGPVVHADGLHAPAALLTSAAEHPNRMFKIIVQTRSGAAPEAAVRRAGGTVNKNLAMINAVAATVPGRSLRLLASLRSVNWISRDAVVRSQGAWNTGNSSSLVNSYDASVGADQAWAQGRYGSGVNVAVVDSGVNPTPDLDSSRLLGTTSSNSTEPTVSDGYGHGSFVAGVVAGNGSAGNGRYIGIAPRAGILNVKVLDSRGHATVSDVINGLQWVYDNRNTYHIRVVNLSLDTTLSQSYNVDPLDAACEMLWFNRIVVVVAAGNTGQTSPGIVDSPANDPFVLTVGAVDDKHTPDTSDDTMAPFSTSGTTLDGINKPDVVAPGVDVVSTLGSLSETLAVEHPSHVDSQQYFDMSGTSVATPIVSGAIALLLDTNPWLNPDQVKQRLVSTATRLPSQSGIGPGEVNIAAAIRSGSWTTANTGISPSAGLQASAAGVGAVWNSTGWGTASWGSASWGSASWGSASWGSASWGSASWGSGIWTADFWGKTRRHPHGNDNVGDGDGGSGNSGNGNGGNGDKNKGGQP